MLPSSGSTLLLSVPQPRLQGQDGDFPDSLVLAGAGRSRSEYVINERYSNSLITYSSE